jgi:autotransporter-associated beta strand protein
MKHFLTVFIFLVALLSVSAQIPPTFPASILGQRQVTWNYTGLRPISAAPALGVHPRIFIGPADRTDFCNRLTNTWSGQELFTNYVQRYTAIMRLGRSAGYDNLPNYSQIRYMPDGTSRIGNEGFYDQSFYYTNLVAGQTNNISSMMTNGSGSVFARTLAGEMALEALEDWVYQNVATNQTRATNLAAAMDAWASYLLTLTNFTSSSQNWMLGGGAAFAEAYDFNYWAMTSAQRAHVRTAICRIMYAAPYYGVGLQPNAVTSNWESLNTFQLIMLMAMEGETSAAVEGFDTNYFNAYFVNAMGSIYDFLTYGWHPSGEMFEGMGKGWFGGARQIAIAKRGYNFFGHPHLQNYVNNDWPACLQPFGYSWTHYDLIGGEGADNLRGLRYYTASDEIAMQWVYTNFPAAAFLWRNFATTAWCSNSVATGTNNYKFFLDFRDSKFAVSSSYGQDLLEAALFVQDPVTNIDWNVQSATVRSNLDFVDTLGSTIVGRSGTDSNSVSFQFHTRQDLGGHTFAERGGFAISGLGRNWVWFPYALNYGQDSGFSSMILVDDLAMFVTLEDGYKMRIPAKLAGWNENSSALFATCDSTYAYTWAWAWNSYPAGGSVTLNSGYQIETNCLNSFRRSNNLISENFGNTPMVSYPHWDTPGYLEGFQRQSYNPMQQVIRTAGLVRGVKPYVFVADDIQKDSNSHVYKWLLQIPKDLTLKTGAALPAGFNTNTDCVLPEAATNGNRSLLVRIMSPTNWSAYTETVSNVTYNSEQFYRLVVIATNIAPAFKVMLYPFAGSGPIPTNTWTATNIFTVAISNQTDTFTFAPRSVTTTDGRTVTMNEFQITRSGTNIVDYRNQIEPFASTVAAVGSPPSAPTNLVGVAGDYSATLTWPAVTNAAGYNLKRSTTSGGPYTNVLTQTVSTNVVDTGVFNGTTYFYVVTAVNAGGESTNSIEISVTPGLGGAHTAANLIWSGDNAWNLWDIQNTNNLVWLNGGTNTTFWNGDSVTFADPGSVSPAVNLVQPLSPAGVVEVNTTNSYTFSGSGKITGNCSLQKDGAGTLTVGMPNDFTGGTILNAGTVSITSPSALGTNFIDFAGSGALQWNGITTDLSAQMKIENTASATVDTMVNNVSFATPFTLGGAAGGALVKIGSGGLTFNSINNYSGGTTIGGGYVSITNNLSLGAASGPLTISNGATLKVSGNDVTMTRTVTLGPGGAVFHPAQNRKITLNGKVTGVGGLTVIWDAYSVILGSALNDFAGDMLIGAADTLGFGSTAIMQLGVDNALPFGAGKGNVVFGLTAGKSDILDLNGHNAQVNGLVSSANTNAFVDNKSGSGTYTLTVGNNNTTSLFGGVITDTSGTINLVKTGLGTLTLSGSNVYSGTTVINSGALALNGFGSISSSPLVSIGSNAVFDISGLTNTFALNGAQTLSNAAAATGIICGNFNDAAGTNYFSFTNGTPALFVTNGTFTLAATTVFKLNNLGSALLPGSYKIIARATNGSAGSVAGSLPALSVNGGGILAGATAALQISGNELYLVVSNISTTTALTLTTGGNPSTAGSTLIFTAIVQTNGIAAGNATSNFVFKVDGVAVATNPVTGGQATFTSSTLAAGSHSIVAEYRADAIYAPSTNSIVQTVNPATPPVIGNILLAGTNVIITGTNGVGAGNYYVLAATNLSTPMAGWTVLATNQFGNGGSVNCTNPQNPNSPQTFYRLRLP